MPIPVIIVVGPTAVGKSAFAVSVAEMLNTAIISADSMQVYRGMSIGVAALSADELAKVRHHFVGIIEPHDSFSAADFARKALEVVHELNACGKVPVVVGGSGLYVRALVDGLFPGPPADRRLRRRFKEAATEKGSNYLHERLREVDPASAAKIHHNDARKIIRALEVCELTGIPISELQRKYRDMKPDLATTFIGLERERQDLYNRIDERVERMFDLGFMGEVAELLEHGYGDEIERIRPLGYPEVKAYLLGEFDLDHAKYLIKRNSRRYAKRQFTWFKADPRIKWFRFSPDEEAADFAVQICCAVGITC
ncbi:MAG: tRNA (adenosine(37)-N6)-dimethylallyltransferase MiaA [Candidatus Hydrogenedentes bacterium]|nr:tRNA (adenosine(37)-N6)-dimethylallyltransferase MiaA [Candidatus Hydrogenedentota bacterium]